MYMKLHSKSHSGSQSGILHIGLGFVILLALVLSGLYLFYLSEYGGLPLKSSALIRESLCKGEGASCSFSPCCTGLYCNSSKVCVSADSDKVVDCINEGGSCESVDCCEGLECNTESVCVIGEVVAPVCADIGEYCYDSTDCCGGNSACSGDHICYTMSTTEPCESGAARCSPTAWGCFDICIDGRWYQDVNRTCCECLCVNNSNFVPYCKPCDDPPPPAEGCSQDDYPRCQDGYCDKPGMCCKKDEVNKSCKCIKCPSESLQ